MTMTKEREKMLHVRIDRSMRSFPGNMKEEDKRLIIHCAYTALEVFKQDLARMPGAPEHDRIREEFERYVERTADLIDRLE